MRKPKSRTEYSIRNTTVAFLAQAAAILMGFFTRVVFTHTLSEGYVGINGLFTDIINILSLSELGVGTAILFALYEPIAHHDIRKQQMLMQMFGKFYRMTAGIVLITGLMLAPWLEHFMKNRPDVDHLLLIYLLYLFNSVLSYLLVCIRGTFRPAYRKIHSLSAAAESAFGSCLSQDMGIPAVAGPFYKTGVCINVKGR